MLPRVLEPEVMDTALEAADYDAMDHREVNARFADDFFKFWPYPGKVLDVGTGTAQIPIELCKASADLQVVGVDLAEEMLKLARRNVDRAGLAERIALEKADGKRLPFADGTFDAVVSNSIVHHIPEPRHALREMVRVVRDGGCLFVRDLCRPADLVQLRQLVSLYAGDANEHQRKMFGESLHAALTLAEIQELAAELGFAKETVSMTSDRHWTWALVS